MSRCKFAKERGLSVHSLRYWDEKFYGKPTIVDLISPDKSELFVELLASFDGLCGIVQKKLQKEPIPSSVFIFFNKPRTQGITHLNCWAHARRYFEKALKNDEEHASKILEMIQRLYGVEEEARDQKLSYKERHELRSEKSLLPTTERVMPKCSTASLPPAPRTISIITTGSFM